MTEISKTADKALAILIELSAGDPITPQQVALRLGVNRTVVQRLLTTLLARGFVARSGGEYTLAPRVRRLAASVQPVVRHAVQPHALKLSKRTGETVVFQVIDGDEVVVLDEFVQTRNTSIQVRHDVGSRSPIAQSASGLAILAALDRQAFDHVLRSLGDEDGSVMQKVATAREEGFAQTSDELKAGVSGLASAVLRAGSVVGSLGVLVPTTRASDLELHRKDLLRTVKRIENSF